MPKFTVIIPARYDSTRLPGKPLADIAGKPMIWHVAMRAKQSGATRVIIATDHQTVCDVMKQAGFDVCLTKTTHQSGTERLAEVIEHYHFADDEIIVNVQGDEPLIPPEIVHQVAKNLVDSNMEMATLAVPITAQNALFNPNVVKVVCDKKGRALYFSRAPIPWDREKFSQSTQSYELNGYLRHIGIYAYRAGFLREYVNWDDSPLEHIELLEQLRVLWYGKSIHVDVAKIEPQTGVDTQDDLERVRQILRDALKN